MTRADRRRSIEPSVAPRRASATRRACGRGAGLVVGVALAAGCYTHSVRVSGTLPEPRPAASEWHHYVLWGLVPLSGEPDLRAACPVGAARIESQMEVPNLLLHIVTAGLYSSLTTDIYCQAPDVPLSPAPPVSEPPLPSGAPSTVAPTGGSAAPTEGSAAPAEGAAAPAERSAGTP